MTELTTQTGSALLDFSHPNLLSKKISSISVFMIKSFSCNGFRIILRHLEEIRTM